MERIQVKEAIRKLKIGKALDTDSIRAEMLKYGGAIVEWMLWMREEELLKPL